MPGLYLPQPGYLEFLREITAANGALLIFDEVMTGFRLAKGGAQERFGITPDLSCFGKVIGGGLPVGAFGGRARDHGLPRAAGPGVSGRHAERQPAGDGGRHRRPGGAGGERRLREAGSSSAPRSKRA